MHREQQREAEKRLKKIQLQDEEKIREMKEKDEQERKKREEIVQSNLAREKEHEAQM